MKSSSQRLLAVLLMVVNSGVEVAKAADQPTIEVYKLPDCGCCKAWVKYLEIKGFEVKVTDLADVEAKQALQDRLGVPKHLRSCHTAVIGGYVVEGHVAVEDIRYLLAQRPEWKGLFINGMPRGAPGMEGGEPEAYDVIAVDLAGREQSYGHHGPSP